MHAVNRKPGIWLRVVSVVAIGFGLLTIKEGGMTLSGDAEAVATAGTYVPFVLWFNSLAGFAYVVAGVGLWMQRRWAAWLAVGIAVVPPRSYSSLSPCMWHPAAPTRSAQ